MAFSWTACHAALRPHRAAVRVYAESKSDRKSNGLLRSALKGSPKGSNLTAISLANRLKDLGITQEPEIRRIVDIMTNPNSLYGTKSGRQPVNPYARNVSVNEVDQVVGYLTEEVGFSNTSVQQLVQSFPQILCYSVDERLRLLVDYLVESVGIPQDDVRAILLKRPTLFGLQKGQLEQMLGFLLNNGTPMEDIIAMLETSL
ncbi:hypothetical protein M9435_003418 [Picochlorum sp. BPE23]|nr:hypothetical protein M9435_003418 [Picochlorum sp. BPE23]